MQSLTFRSGVPKFQLIFSACT